MNIGAGRRSLLVAALLAPMVSTAGAGGEVVAVRDRISKPPSPREFASRNGRFRLRLELALDKPGRVIASVRDTADGRAERVVWQQLLPHSWGPRTAVVADDGAVLLIDEWINVVSRRALTVLDPKGDVVAVHPGEEIFSKLDVARRSISAAATAGIWRTGEPMLSADGKSVDILSAGRRVRIRFDDGQLTVLD